jgi:hypothetical protein
MINSEDSGTAGICAGHAIDGTTSLRPNVRDA